MQYTEYVATLIYHLQNLEIQSQEYASYNRMFYPHTIHTVAIPALKECISTLKTLKEDLKNKTN